MTLKAPQYLFNPADKPALPLYDVPLVEATEETVQGYGCLVSHPDDI
ncbi:MAG: ureidoglycolate hydrolase, partial [Proteobacteria bacterium]|nr:ureidoglycolate hydrolase [Pseudomonadota bacterium]